MCKIMLALNIFHTLFYCFHCCFWAGKYRLGCAFHMFGSILFPFKTREINKYNFGLWCLCGSCLIDIVLISLRDRDFISFLRKINRNLIKILLQNTFTAWKVSKYGVFSGPNTGEYGPENTPYWDTFHAVIENITLEKQCIFKAASGTTHSNIPVGKRPEVNVQSCWEHLRIL